jgi:phosphatidylglycerophosphate synthase
MLARLRPLYNKFVMPIGEFSFRIGFKPDLWTLLSLAMAFIAGYCLFKGFFWLGFLFSLFMYLADMLDGATARAGNMSTNFGTVFDHVIDRYAEMIIIGSLLLGGWISPAATLFSISGVIMASYVRAKAESAGGLNDCAVGLAGRAEKLILTYGGILLLAISKPLPAEICFWVLGLIGNITAVQRLLYARKMLLGTVSTKIQRRSEIKP